MYIWKTSIIHLGVSLAVTFILGWIGLPFFFLFLIIPLLPFLGKKKEMRRCPTCGWLTVGCE